MKIMLGVLAAMAILVGVLWWRLDVVAGDRDLAAQRADIATQAVEEQKRQSTLLGQRFDAFDQALKGIGEKTAENNKKLGQTITAIGNIQKTQGDSDESIKCLDVRVPGQLDQWLR
jgi:hypothetical protein